VVLNKHLFIKLSVLENQTGVLQFEKHISFYLKFARVSLEYIF